jgi:hypothetical protein
MVEVVDLNARRKPVEPELVEYLRILLSEAQNGRLTGFAVAYYDDEGLLDTAFHTESIHHSITAASVLHQAALALLEE